MKQVRSIVMGLGMLVGSFMGMGQSGDQRMEQDIEVAENILGTLLRQQQGRRSFFPVEVNGNYMPGYGVTFRLPMGGPFRGFSMSGFDQPGQPAMIWGDEPNRSYSFSYSRSDDDNRKDIEKKIESKIRSKTAKAARELNSDSLSTLASKRFMEVARNFLADYGDVISGLKPDERIVITNRMEEFGGDFEMAWIDGRQGKRSLLSVETKRDDISQLKQGKISRVEFLSRLKTVNTESSESLDPDLEVLSSMFGRLYREDLSKTYYVQGNVSYERLKDFGVIYYMKVYSSIEEEGNGFAMPTIAGRNMPQAERDKKVKELYPRFESDLKDNLVEYARTLRSLKEDEQVVLNVRLTKCEKCGIPASLEISIKSSALKEYNSGKASKEATLGKVVVKKAGVQ